MTYMTVYVDGLPAQREIDTVERRPFPEPLHLMPKLREGETCYKCVDGRVVVLEAKRAGRFLTSVVEEAPDQHEGRQFLAEYSDGSVEVWDLDRFKFWQSLEHDE